MTTPDRLEIQYATFVAEVRLDSQTSVTRVVVSSGPTKVYCGTIHGILHLIVEDPSLRHPATIPWTNVASVGWVGDAPVDFLPAAAPKLKPAAKAKGAEASP